MYILFRYRPTFELWGHIESTIAMNGGPYYYTESSKIITYTIPDTRGSTVYVHVFMAWSSNIVDDLSVVVVVIVYCWERFEDSKGP